MDSPEQAPTPAGAQPSGESASVSTTPDWEAPERWASMRDFGVTRWLLLAGVSLAVAGGGVAAVSGADTVSGWLGAAAVCAVAVVLLLATVLWTPALLTRQGVSADAHAATLVAEPMWWFSGRRARVPWSAIRKVRTKITGDPWVGPSKPSLSEKTRVRSYYIDLWLRHSATRYQPPVWASISRRDRLRHRRNPKKPPKRLHIETTWVGTKRVMILLWTVRPDYFVGEDGRPAGGSGRAPRYPDGRS